MSAGSPWFGGQGLGWYSTLHLLHGLRQVMSLLSLSTLLPGTVTPGTGHHAASTEPGLRELLGKWWP